MKHDILLQGCQPEPLASYLKSLAVLRLVSEQVDATAQGYWTAEGFVLRSRMNREELTDFFLNDYAPTPLVAPWNNGSGFYQKDNKSGIDGIANCEYPRFTQFREIIRAIRNTSALRKESEEEKAAVQNSVRAVLPDAVIPWIDAAYSVLNDDSVKYNPILGTGGNEGRLDLTNNYMQRLVELLIQGGSSNVQEYLENALWDSVANGLIKASIGQFDPGRAGGYNQGMEVETKSFKINPWDFIFMLEGSLLLTSSVYKRTDISTTGWAAFPFAVFCSGIGHGSSVYEEGGRSEIWLPLWHRPTTIGEVRHLFAEGRSMVGRRKAKTGLDFARAVCSLGVDRGIAAFARYSFLERRGQSYVALPAGRLPVRYNEKAHLLDDLDPILDKLDGFIRQFANIPAAFATARRRIDEAMYECSVRGEAPAFVRMVRALGRMEFLLGQRDRTKEPKLHGPLSGLRMAWIDACGANQPEVRLAVALASIQATENVGGIRSNMAGVDPPKPWSWATGKGQRHWAGSNFVERLAGVFSRRVMDARRLNRQPLVPLSAWVPISPHDVTPFLLGETDDTLLEELLWGFTLIRFEMKTSGELARRFFRPLNATQPLPRPYAVLKLLFSAGTVREKTIRMEPRILPLLRARETDKAVAVAAKRLRISNLPCLPVEDHGWLDPLRLYAGLTFPVSGLRYLEQLVFAVTESHAEEGETHV